MVILTGVDVTGVENDIFLFWVFRVRFRKSKIGIIYFFHFKFKSFMFVVTLTVRFYFLRRLIALQVFSVPGIMHRYQLKLFCIKSGALLLKRLFS